MQGGGTAGRNRHWEILTGLMWGSTHLQRGLLIEKLVHRSEHDVRRALVRVEVGRSRPDGAYWCA